MPFQAQPITAATAQIPADPRAPVLVEFPIHALRTAFIDRGHLKELGKDWEQPGVYVLIGARSGKATEIYVGKAHGKKGVRSRLFTQRNKPLLQSWWRAVAVLRDTSNGFNSAEVGYLEGRLASELRALPHLAVAEGRADIDMTLPEHMLAQLDALVPTILAALRIAGLDLEEAAETRNERRRARSRMSVEGTVGDLLSAGLIQAGDRLAFTRKGKTENASVTPTGGLVVRGIEYETPTTAAKAAHGLSSVNGWTAWRRVTNGKSLANLRDELNQTSGN